MTHADKLAMVAALDVALKAMRTLETACTDHNMPDKDHEEVCDLTHAVWRMRRRISEKA